MSFEADLNVLALSDSNVTGSPLLLVNRRKASMKASELSLFVNSKCTALVEAHVNKHTHALESSSFAPFSEVYRGPAKSTPVCVKGGSSETRSSGRSGCCGSEKCFPPTFLHASHASSNNLLNSLSSSYYPESLSHRRQSCVYSTVQHSIVCVLDDQHHDALRATKLEF